MGKFIETESRPEVGRDTGESSDSGELMKGQMVGG